MGSYRVPKLETLNPKGLDLPETLNPKPETLAPNPKPETVALNPKP